MSIGAAPRSTRAEQTRTLLSLAGGLGLLAAGVLFVVLVLPGDPRFTTAWTTAVFGLLAGGAALLSASASASSVATARRALGQQLYELARATHTDLTTGEVAAARDRLGTLVRIRRRLWAAPLEPNSMRDSAIRSAYDPGMDGEAMARWRRDWFTLLWCFQRVHAALVLLAQTPPELVAAGQQSPRDFLADLVRVQVRFLNIDAADIRAALEEHHRAPVDDVESAHAFRDLVADLLPDTTPGAWADPVTTDYGESLLALLLEPDGTVPTVRGDVALAALRDEQFDALHRAILHSGDGRLAERMTFGRRLRMDADDAAAAGDDASATLLRDRAQIMIERMPAEDPADGPGEGPGDSAGPAT